MILAMRVAAGAMALAAGWGAQAASAQATKPPQVVQRPLSAARQGMVDAGRAASANGGRPEIRTREEMARLSGYTAPAAKAYAALATDASAGLWPVTLYYRCHNRSSGGTAIHAPLPAPIEVFDGVYSVGDDENNVWAIDSKEGIILLDTLSNEEDAKRIIVANMRQLKLDPARIRLIVVTHSHGDHYGGAAYLKSLSGAHIAMSQADWDGKPMGTPLPVKGPGDFYLTDGQKLTLGERTLTVVATPGHTPGTVSLVFPVTDHGVPHVASLFGGQGAPREVASLVTFRHALDHFADYTDRMGADVVLSNHTVGDDGLTRVAALAKRKPGEPNPYVVGREAVIRYDALWRACLGANIAQALTTSDPVSAASR